MEEIKLLFLNSCIRREESRTLALCQYYIDEFAKALGDICVQVKELKLDEMDIPLQDYNLLKKREELIKRKDFKDPIFDYAREIISADYVVVGAPYWDWQFPATLKIFLERASVSGLTYIFDENNESHGNCMAGRAIYITTAGSFIRNLNFGYQYVKALFEIFGIPHTDFVSAEGLDLPGTYIDKVMEKAKTKLKSVAEESAVLYLG